MEPQKLLRPGWRCQGFLLCPVASPLVYGQLARMCLWGHPKFNPGEQRHSGEPCSRFFSPHTPLVGTRPGFCSGWRWYLWFISAPSWFISSPRKWDAWKVFLSHKRLSSGVIPDQAEAEPWDWVVPNWLELQAQLKFWITKPVFASLQKLLLCLIRTEEGKWIARKMISWSLLSMVWIVSG